MPLNDDLDALFATNAWQRWRPLWKMSKLLAVVTALAWLLAWLVLGPIALCSWIGSALKRLR